MLALILALSLAEPPSYPALVADLAHDSWTVRDRAHAQLARAGLKACPAIKAALAGDDREQTLRCEALLALHLERWGTENKAQAIADVDAHFKTLPCIDFVMWDGTQIDHAGTWNAIYATYWNLDLCAPADPRGWGRYRLATRLWFYDLRSAGVPMGLLEMFAGELWRREGEYLEKCKPKP